MTKAKATAKKEATKAAAPAPEAKAPMPPTPMQRPATPEEAAQVQLQQQRGRAEVAVLKQRFAETDVAMTIAQAECGQLVQQNQMLQQENERLKAELAADPEPEDGQTTPAAPAPKD